MDNDAGRLYTDRKRIFFEVVLPIIKKSHRADNPFVFIEGLYMDIAMKIGCGYRFLLYGYIG